MRYIFYTNDLFDLIRDLTDLGFKNKSYINTPITKTIYFGSKIGLKPGLSLKARIYTNRSEPNIWTMDSNSRFDLLEIKTSITRNDNFFFYGLKNEKDISNQGKFINKLMNNINTDVLYRIQKASEDGLLRDSNLKTKSRVKKVDISSERSQLKLTLKEIIDILCKATPLDKDLSDNLITFLNNKIRPLFSNSLLPYVMTQYRRKHLIPQDLDLQDFIRITIDPGVEYYSVNFKNNKYLIDPIVVGEYLTRERFCRLEFKIDPLKLGENKDLIKKLSNILRKYGCIAYISKKWSGVTLVSERHIEKQAFWKDPISKQISGFFPVNDTWFSYGQITEELFKIINYTKSFSSYEEQPRILVKNTNSVHGYIGVPIPSLVVSVAGPKISYTRPPQGHIVKLIKDQPEFYIMEEDELPVRSTIISSKNELERILHPSIRIEGYSYFRSYGFLVVHNQSNRVYKLTIERKTDINEGEPNSEIYCKLRYVGNNIGPKIMDKNDIYKELQDFYEEFYPVMDNIISEESPRYVNVFDEAPLKRS